MAAMVPDDASAGGLAEVFFACAAEAIAAPWDCAGAGTCAGRPAASAGAANCRRVLAVGWWCCGAASVGVAANGVVVPPACAAASPCAAGALDTGSANDGSLSIRLGNPDARSVPADDEADMPASAATCGAAEGAAVCG
jgi:hypothetical protein